MAVRLMHTSKFGVNQLLSMASSLFAKLCSTCVHRSVQEFEIYRIISSPLPISYTRGILGRSVVGYSSNTHLQVWCLPTPLHHFCLVNFVQCLHRSVKDLEICSIISGLVPMSESGGTLGRAVVKCTPPS